MSIIFGREYDLDVNVCIWVHSEVCLASRVWIRQDTQQFSTAYPLIYFEKFNTSYL